MYHCPRCWVAETVEEAHEALEWIETNVPGFGDDTLHWLGQSKQRSKVHLGDLRFLTFPGLLGAVHRLRFGRRRFLESLGVHPLKPYVIVSLCDDGVVMVEYMVRCSDGQMYSRHDALDLIPYCPTPEQIRESAEAIRHEKPVHNYNDQWVGIDGAGIREY